jgi:hypothetical protein
MTKITLEEHKKKEHLAFPMHFRVTCKMTN